MEHSPTKEEFEITASIDFILPLKQVGLITRSVLEAISKFYKPRRIIVISARSEGPLLMHLVKYWDVCTTEFIAEESFFEPNFNLSLAQIISEYDPEREGDQREPGWWIQQLIKLGAATQIADISDTYVVWDGDLVPTRRWRLCERDANGRINYFIAILQAESRSEFNTTQYAQCMEALVGFSPLDPVDGGTFVAHHMIFQKEYVNEMLNLMATKTGSDLAWPLLIMSHSRKFYRFSEYKTYASFMLIHHPEDFHYHKLQHFGEGGLRFRVANEIVAEMLEKCALKNGGLSYNQVSTFMDEKLQQMPKGENAVYPAYVQLDHVYGLVGIDLNLTGASVLTGRDTTPIESEGHLVVSSKQEDSPDCCVCLNEDPSIDCDDQVTGALEDNHNFQNNSIVMILTPIEEDQLIRSQFSIETISESDDDLHSRHDTTRGVNATLPTSARLGLNAFDGDTVNNELFNRPNNNRLNTISRVLRPMMFPSIYRSVRLPRTWMNTK